MARFPDYHPYTGKHLPDWSPFDVLLRAARPAAEGGNTQMSHAEATHTGSVAMQRTTCDGSPNRDPLPSHHLSFWNTVQVRHRHVLSNRQAELKIGHIRHIDGTALNAGCLVGT